MSRIYAVQLPSSTVSVAQDLVCIYSTGTTAKLARLLRVVLSATDTNIPTSQMIEIQVKALTGTVTAGTGGASATPQKIDPGDPVAIYTARTFDLTTSASGTTTQTVFEGGFHVYNGFDESFVADGASPKRAQPVVIGVASSGSAGSAAIAVHMVSAPTGTVHLSGTAWFEEEG